MDKETVRIIIGATGLLIIVGILIKGLLRDEHFRENLSEFFGGFSLKKWRDREEARHEDDGFDEMSFDEISHHHLVTPEIDEEPIPRPVAPQIIKLTLKSHQQDGFNGKQLIDLMKSVGLVYSSARIFERLDSQRRVDYGVACLIPPGTFPSVQLDAFNCPGVVFFMQPDLLEEPTVVFDDLIDVIGMLAMKLDGRVYDGDNQLLTFDTLQLIRQSL